jgi:hypothetical protein
VESIPASRAAEEKIGERIEKERKREEMYASESARNTKLIDVARQTTINRTVPGSVSTRCRFNELDKQCAIQFIQF